MSSSTSGGVAIRPLARADIPALDRALLAAYGATRSLAPRLEKSLAMPDGTFVATVDALPVGFVCLNDYGASAYVALMGVDPRQQGRGLARALLHALLAMADARGIRSLELDATPSGAPLYASEGFVDDGETIVLEGIVTAAPGGLVERADGAVFGVAHGVDREAMLRADRIAFGADRRSALVPLLDDRSSLVVTQGDDGYAVVQADAIGPVVARDTAVGGALFTRAFAARVGVDVRVCVPSGNRDAVAIVERAGLREQRRLRHMLRGDPISRQAQRIFARINLGQG